MSSYKLFVHKLNINYILNVRQQIKVQMIMTLIERYSLITCPNVLPSIVKSKLYACYSCKITKIFPYFNLFRKKGLHFLQLFVIIINALLDGGCSSVGRAPDRGSGGRGFEPLYPPHFVCGSLAQLVEQGTLNPKVQGSTP